MYQSPFHYAHTIVNGYFTPTFFTQELYDNAQQNNPLQDGDVVISTYPKSGTTLTQNLVFNMLHGKIPDNYTLTTVVPWHECSSKINHFSSENRAWKSHLCWEDTFKTNKKVKYIYVARNGKDVAVSLLHHARGFKLFDYTGDWNDMFERCMSGQIEFGHWYKHVLGWWEAAKTRDDILFLFYEDFIADQEQYIQKVADFLNVTLSESEMERLKEVTSFSSMKDNSQTNYNHVGRRPGLPGFMRKGKVGDWQDYFTEEQNNKFDEMYNNEIVNKSDLRFKFILDE